MQRQRPGPVLWLWYALGGGLPRRYSAWVLHDLSCDRWVLRHFIRAGVQLSVFTAPIMLLVPGPLWVRGAATLLGWLVGLQYALWFLEGTVERRVRRAGYPPDAATEARDALHAEERAAAEARYVARYRGARPEVRAPRPGTASVHGGRGPGNTTPVT